MKNPKFKSLVEIDYCRSKIIDAAYFPYDPVKPLYWDSFNNSSRVVLTKSWEIRNFLRNAYFQK